jgi:hypothetical protein
MKVCVTLVGVCRPSFKQICSNIEKNIEYFTSNYPQHNFSFIVLTYKNGIYEDLSTFCKEKAIQCIFIEPIKSTDFIFPVKVKVPNSYRLMYSMSIVMNYVAKDVDCVVRVRLDTEVIQLELKPVQENIYYGLKESNTSCTDNIGYGSYKLMKNLWKHEHSLLEGKQIEDVLYSALKKLNYSINNVKFHFKLYESNDILWDGIPQWSRRSRELIYDGKKYIKKDI